MAKLDVSDLDKLYDTFDSGHGPDHQQAVRDRSRVLAEMYAPDKLNLVDLAARLHDIGLAKGRESHEQRGAEMVVGDPRFKKLPKRQLRLLVNAIRQHRASTGKPRSIVGKIVSDADRIAGSDVAGALRRSFDYGQKHAPHLTEEGQYRRVLSYLAQKFAPEGIGRRHYFPETGKALADIFDPIIEMHKKDDLDAIRKILQSTQEQEKAAEFAPGLPDPRRFGNVPDLPKGRELLYVVQKHLADRAGPHFDLRFGENLGTKPSLFSWAARHLPSEPGEKRMMFQQPLHTGQYADFEGDITSGYGKGKVKTHDKGRVLVTKVEPDKISFVVTHKKHPEMFTMVRTSGAPTRGTERTKRTQGGSWLMINTTPTDVIAHKKVRYSKVDQADIEKLFSPDYLHEEKIDGAAALYKLFSDKIEILSYRPSTSGRPIVHTYRVGGTTGINIPKRLVGSVLRGELYGVRRDSGEAIPAQELGGILNASTSKSLKKQQAQGVELRNRIFNVIQLGKQRLSPDDPRRERIAQLEEIMQHLPQPKFGLPRRAETPDEQRKMWEEIRSGKNPLTEEGIVAWPAAGGKPTKVKLYEEHDVHVKDIFPGEKRLAGVGAGGFGYSTEPGGPRVGEVGTGFTEETRRQMLEDPDQYIGRVARVKAQAKFPSGALRAPSFLSLHEDYPGVKKTAAAGAVGAGLVGAGLAGPDIATKLIKDKTSKLFNAVVSQTPDYNARYNLRKALGAEEVPHMKLLEMMGDSAKSAPNSINYFAPTADNASFIQTVMTHKPEFAQFARKHGLVLSKGTLTPSSFAHEMGHATGLGQSGLYRKLIGKLYGSGKNSPAIGAVVGGLLGLATKHPKLGALAGGGAAALMHAPTLFEEGRASLRASNALKKLNLKSDQALPYMTYVAPAAGAAAVGAGTSLLAGKLRKLLTLAKKAHADGLTKSGSPHAAEGDYVLNLLAQMKRNPAIADKLYAAGMREKSKFIPKTQEQAMLQEQSDMTLAPTTLGQGATELAMLPAFNVGFSGIGGGYRTARGLLGGAKGPGALASMWKAMQPRAVGSSVTQLASPKWLKFGAGLEGALGTLAAMNDPRYQRGEIPLWKAMIGQVGRMGQSSQIGMAKTMDKPYGTLKGMALSPLQGISSPIGTVTGFGQALGRLGGKVFGKESDMKVLESIIKKAIAAEGGEGTTLADLAKAAQIPDFEMHDEGPQVPDFMQPKRTSIRDWILSRIMGMPTGDIDNLRSALGGASRVAGFFKGAPRLKDQPQFDLSPFSE